MKRVTALLLLLLAACRSPTADWSLVEPLHIARAQDLAGKDVELTLLVRRPEQLPSLDPSRWLADWAIVTFHPDRSGTIEWAHFYLPKEPTSAAPLIRQAFRREAFTLPPQRDTLVRAELARLTPSHALGRVVTPFGCASVVRDAVTFANIHVGSEADHRAFELNSGCGGDGGRAARWLVHEIVRAADPKLAENPLLDS